MQDCMTAAGSPRQTEPARTPRGAASRLGSVAGNNTREAVSLHND